MCILFSVMKEHAQEMLRVALNNQDASFRDGQWESISELLNHKRVLVVQRTGWGKSMVYFLATKLLREQGAGPTLLISPLLSLMRNQIESAKRIGVRATTINSANQDEWHKIEADIKADQIDVLLISPERLANEKFVQNILSGIAGNIGLFVVDEAHCISDWGHDFRPDYRRIVRILQAIPANVPVLATTATANNRVMNDVRSQLGENIGVIRGSLVRKSLKLQNINLPSQAERMAWLAKTVPTIPGSGIVYTLTKIDAERVAKWLQINNIKAQAYHGGLQEGGSGSFSREDLEQQLLNNEIKVLVATVALGMGFDKPDLGFVIHFQRPGSVIHYYQQVGRAGRAMDEAYGVLLCGEEDDRITDYFIRNAFPPQHYVSGILEALEAAENGLSVPGLQSKMNLRYGEINKALKFLTVESPAPITKTGTKWQLTAAGSTYSIDQDYVLGITQLRKQEQKQMQQYMHSKDCLMAFLQDALDDPAPHNCGKCVNCNPGLHLSTEVDKALVVQAHHFLRGTYQPIAPRKVWPEKDMFKHSPLGAYKIPDGLRPQEGRALSMWQDAGWGRLVAQGKYQTRRFSDKLVTACVEMLGAWNPDPAPQWITCIPSLNHTTLVPDFAARLARALGIPFVPCIEKVLSNEQQKDMENSYHQVMNLDGAFKVNKQCQTGACLLVDDVVGSGWTLTVASALLRKAGCTVVHPMALALNTTGMD